MASPVHEPHKIKTVRRTSFPTLEQRKRKLIEAHFNVLKLTPSQVTFDMVSWGSSAVSQEQLAGQTDRLKGSTFVVSGVFETLGRTELKKMIEDNGGKVASSVSSKTTYLVAGDKMGPSKRTKAESLGVPIISEQDFLGMLE